MFGRNKRSGAVQKPSRHSTQAALPPPPEPRAAVPGAERRSRGAARKQTKSEVESKLAYEQRERRNSQKQVAESRAETARVAKKAERLSLDKARMAEHAQSSQARARAERKRADGEERKCTALQKEVEAKAGELAIIQGQLKAYKQIADRARVEAEEARDAMRRMSRDNQQKLDSLKEAHRMDIKRRQKLQQSQLERKSKAVRDQRAKCERLRTSLSHGITEARSARRAGRRAEQRRKEAAASAKQRLGRLSTALEELAGLKVQLDDERWKVEELEEALVEYEMAYDHLQARFDAHKSEYTSVLEFVDHFHELDQPDLFRKRSVKNATRGAHREWGLDMDKLCIEMLANRTPPTCIQANILAMARTMNLPVPELPSVRYIQRLRTVLRTVTKSLGAYRIGNAKQWKQLHTDETGRRRASIVSVVMSVIEEDDELSTVCLNGSLVAEDGTADSQSREIIASFDEAGRMLEEWAEKTKEMYPHRQDLLDQLPKKSDLNVTRLLGGFITGDNCSTARSIRQTLLSMILAIAEKESIPADRRHLFLSSCFNHLRNTWTEAAEGYLSKLLTEHMADDLALIPYHLRIDCKLSHICRMVDKECNETCNYAKGKGNEFQYERETFHPGKRYLPIVRVLGGARQDASFEGAFPIYNGRHDIMAFLHKRLKCGENILETSLYMMLKSMEVTAMLRVASIYHLAVVVPMRYLAGTTHELAHRNWGERSMGRALDLLNDAMLEVQQDGTKFLDEDFMMKIFQPLYADLPELENYREYFFEEKVGKVNGSNKKDERVLAIDEAQAELFYTQRAENRQTTRFCEEIAPGLAATILTELADPKKATHEYLSAAGGKYSQAHVSLEEVEASMNIRATNDPDQCLEAGVGFETRDKSRGVESGVERKL